MARRKKIVKRGRGAAYLGVFTRRRRPGIGEGQEPSHSSQRRDVFVSVDARRLDKSTQKRVRMRGIPATFDEKVQAVGKVNRYREKGVGIVEACKRAKVSRSLYYRWGDETGLVSPGDFARGSNGVRRA